MRHPFAWLVLPVVAFAQAPMTMEFPVGAEVVTPEALHQRVAGKVLTGRPADGTTWRLDYRANGNAFLDTSTGTRDTGKWRVEGSKFCTDWQRVPGGCSEARVLGDVIYVKRNSNGEIVPLSPN